MSKDTEHSGTTSRISQATRLLPSCTLSNSSDNLDYGADLWKQECLKLLRELNWELSSYHNLLLGYGVRRDSDNLREELKQTRRKAQDLIKVLKMKLLPHITSEEHDRLDLERLWFLFVSCLDVLQSEMMKTLTLQRMFMLHSDSYSFINLNFDDLERNQDGKLDLSSLDCNFERICFQREELCSLEREVADLKELCMEVHRIVDIKPSTESSTDSISFPGNNNRLFPASDQTCGLSDESSVVEEVTNCQHKCICWIITTMVSVFLLGTVLGVCIAFLS